MPRGEANPSMTTRGSSCVRTSTTSRRSSTSWDLLGGNLRQLLDEGESPVHEPAFNPDPDEYVTWDYARGFLDGYEMLQDEETEEVANRLGSELAGRGWTPAAIESLLTSVGLSGSSRDERPGND
jgi:hypothetical protein